LFQERNAVKIGIVGGGIFGTSAAYALAKRGHHVHIFEQEAPLSKDAASFDISKAIRFEYGAMTPSYLPLVEQAFALWDALEKESGRQVLHQTGMLFLSESENEDSFEMQSHVHLKGTPYANTFVGKADGEKRWPQFSWTKVNMGFHNPLGGWIEATAAVELLRNGALENGARLSQETILDIQETGGSVRLIAKENTYPFDQVVVAAGPWLTKLLPDLKDHCSITRQQVCFFTPSRPSVFAGHHFPVWAYDLEHRGWYGFPINSNGVLKVASHKKNNPVDVNVSRECDETFFQEATAFAKEIIEPLGQERASGGRVCLYTNSPHGHPLIDRHPDCRNIIIAGFGNGHGFKFGPLLGECAADVVEDKDTNPIFQWSEKQGIVI
jgi:glycine/D-amino acid oxidase-like deaminating enzyme